MSNTEDFSKCVAYLQALRVAEYELTSGNAEGRVYEQLSEGSVFFLSSRETVKNRISSEIMKASSRIDDKERFSQEKQENEKIEWPADLWNKKYFKQSK